MLVYQKVATVFSDQRIVLDGSSNKAPEVMEFRDGLDCHRSWDVALFMALVSFFVSGTALVFLVLRMIFDLLRQSEIHSHHKNWLQNWVHLKLAGESMIKVSPAVQWASPSGIGY